MLRAMRRWMTRNATSAACRMAPFVPDVCTDISEQMLAATGTMLPVVARQVRRNMRAAGVLPARVGRPDAARAYFRQAARHFANAARILKLADRPEAVAALARRQVDVDPSIVHLKEAMSTGRGAIVAAPHVCNYVLTLTRLNQEVPITVYLRWSRDERRRELKHAWCRAAGLPVILEPPDEANPTRRAAACVEALQKGAALVMTPDIAQKDRDGGVPVVMLGKTPYLPAGPASIAMLAEAPIVPVFGRLREGGDVHVITVEPPIFVEHLSRDQGGRRMTLHRAMQKWTASFEIFLRKSPEAWFLWADSRWTRVFQDNPRYQGEIPANAEEPLPSGRAALHQPTSSAPQVTP